MQCLKLNTLNVQYLVKKHYSTITNSLPNMVNFSLSSIKKMIIIRHRKGKNKRTQCIFKDTYIASILFNNVNQCISHRISTSWRADKAAPSSNNYCFIAHKYNLVHTTWQSRLFNISTRLMLLQDSLIPVLHLLKQLQRCISNFRYLFYLDLILCI